MKKIILIITFVIVLSSIAYGSIYYDKNNNKLIESNNTYEIQKVGGLYFIESKSGYFDFIFDKEGTSAKQIRNNNKGNCTVINGGYFGYIDNYFAPAGGIVYKDISGKSFTNIASSSIKITPDPNLSVNLSYDQLNNKIYLGEITGNINFHAGPLMIENGIINSDLNKNISHRKGKYKRTFMIIDSNNKSPIFGFTTYRYTLIDLVKDITNSGYLTGTYSIVNLDGGPSTSFSSKSFQYNENQKLPWFFTICDH